jgi:hypothetical protein
VGCKKVYVRFMFSRQQEVKAALVVRVDR